MKTPYTAKLLCLLVAASLTALAGEAQTAAALEFSSGGGPTGGGATIAAQPVTFRNNTNNPTGNTFVAFSSPTTIATFSFTNQQYTLPTTQLGPGYPMVFGAAINNSGPKALNNLLYAQMSSISAPSDNNFTSVGATPGTGISVTNNYATEFMVSAMPLYNNNLSTTGRYYMGDLTISFNVPLTNPILHFVGVGATAGSLGFTSEFELSSTGVTLTELSGSSELTVVSNKLLNNAAHPSSTTGNGAFSGSILATGTNISTITFKIYVRGDGGAAEWATSNSHSGDQILIGVSTISPVAILPINLNGFTAVQQGTNTLLQWSTGRENNSSFFDIQYSTDQINWQSIGSVNAAGHSATGRKYSFIHSSPAPGTNYYRLRMVDRDNNFSWSPIVEQSFATVLQLMGYPNPTKGNFTLTGITGPFTAVTVMSLDGKPLQRITNYVPGAAIQLGHYPPGVYLISVIDNGKTQLLKVFKE